MLFFMAVRTFAGDGTATNKSEAVQGEQPTRFESETWGDTPNQTYCQAAYGDRNGKIAFVFFQTEHGTPSKENRLKHLTLKSYPKLGDVCEGWIEMPNGTRRDLPSSKMVFECTDGVFHAAPIDLTLDDFSRYLDSIQRRPVGVDPNGLTVEALKEFEKKIKTKLSELPGLRQKADKGDSAAEFSLGERYRTGSGVESNMAEAAKWFRKAAEQGYAAAQRALGFCYCKGFGVESNLTEGVKWFRKAAEQGYAKGQYNLGLCYYYGWGLETNQTEAVKWYRKAAEQGEVAAQFNLGVCYAGGNGVEKNQGEAVKWYREAAEQGDAHAQLNLGLCYAGGNGVEKNQNEAIKWYRKAAEQGNAKALYLLGVPLDDATARVPHVGTIQEYNIDDPNYDVLVCHFDGTKGIKPTDLVNTSLAGIRRSGFKNNKKMTLIVFCDLTTTSKSHSVVYPYGIYLESAAIRDPSIYISDLTKGPLIASPMNWNDRISDWVYSTNNFNGSEPKITENPNYVKSSAALDSGWLFELDQLKDRVEVHAKFGDPKYLVEDRGAHSEVYPVEDVNRNQTGAVRIWYDGDKVTKTGCYMDNK